MFGDGRLRAETAVGRGKVPVQALLALPLAATIFAVDTFTQLLSAVAVLYGLVIMLAGGVLQGRRLVLAAVACAALTAASYGVDHGFTIDGSPFVRALVSVSAITATTWLVLRNQAAAEVLRSQAALLELTHDAIFVRSMSGAIRFWNRGAELLYGWTAREATGAQADTLLSPRLPGDADAIMTELLREGRWEGEVVHCGRDGQRLTVASRWALQRGRDGAPLAVLETNTDVTGRKRADAELQQAQAELAQASRLTTLGQFTATIAHEVNQPLGAIATNGEAALRFLGRPQPDLVEVRGALERIIVGATRASQVVARVRSMLKRGAPERARVEIAPLVEETGLLMRRDLQARRVDLVVELDADLPPVLGDRTQLQQVLVNLLANGAQAMVDTDGPRALVVRVGRTEDGGVRVQVRDRGPGIGEADMARLFSPFFTTRAEGMGLGLAICMSIIESHGGTIRAAAAEGPGALIEFTLPAAEAA